MQNLKERDHLDDLTFCWKDNIKEDLKEIGHDGVDWIHLAMDKVQWWAVVNMVMNLRVA
jgi:hypothetical protein